MQSQGRPSVRPAGRPSASDGREKGGRAAAPAPPGGAGNSRAEAAARRGGAAGMPIQGRLRKTPNGTCRARECGAHWAASRAGRIASMPHGPPAAAQIVKSPFFQAAAGSPAAEATGRGSPTCRSAGGGGRLDGDAAAAPRRGSGAPGGTGGGAHAAGGTLRMRAAARRRSMSVALGAAGRAFSRRVTRGTRLGVKQAVRNGRRAARVLPSSVQKRKARRRSAAPKQGP